MSSLRRKKQLVGYAAVYYIHMNMVKARSPRSIWMKSWLSDKTKFGHLPLINELRNNNPEDFKNYLRIDGTTFDFLLSIYISIIYYIYYLIFFLHFSVVQ